MSSKIVQMVDSLPPLPVLANLIRAFARSDTTGDLRELSEAIKQEPTVTAKVMGIANSAYYHSGSPVCTVESAASRLGIRQLKVTVLSLVLAQRFDPSHCAGFDLGRYWYDAMMTAHCTVHVLGFVKPKVAVDRNAMMCVGLLHNIGLLLMVEQYPEEMAALIQLCAEAQGVGLSLTEPEVFSGENHFSLGAKLLSHWGLPQVYSVTISNLVHPDKAGKDALFASIVRLAKQLVDAFAHGAEMPEPQHNLLPDISEEDIREIIQKMMLDHKATEAFLPYLSGHGA